MRALCILVLGLAACGTQTEPPPPPTVASAEEQAVASPHGSTASPSAATYTCADGQSFRVTPRADGASAEVALPSDTLTLDRTDASMGVRYGEGATEVWIADEGAFVRENGAMTLADCRLASDA